MSEIKEWHRKAARVMHDELEATDTQQSYWEHPSFAEIIAAHDPGIGIERADGTPIPAQEYNDNMQRMIAAEARLAESEAKYKGMTSACVDEGNARYKAEKRLAEAEALLQLNANTFRDFSIALRLLNHPVAAEAAMMADQVTRTFLTQKEVSDAK